MMARSLRLLAIGALVSYLAGCSSDSSNKAGRDAGPDASRTTTDASPADAGAASSSKPTPEGDASDSGPRRFEVKLMNGPVNGVQDGKVRAFYGIPYAAPPTGSNRFKPPQPVVPWSMPLDASKPRKVCPQISVGSTAVNAMSDEDCLVLNVWTPDPPSSAPLPVMVWIHGGAFAFGSGGETYYDAGSLVTEGRVVVVGINYRLGALGFLPLPALTAEDKSHPTSGNYGFEDQQAALRWVKDNIGEFGGDPKNVTIFGESAGGYSVCAHLVAPGSAGLFHKAISESGLCSSLIDATLDAQYAHGEAFAQAMGCTDPAKVLDCLRGKDANDYLTASTGSMLPGGLFFQGPRSAGESDGGVEHLSSAWSPVIDGVDIPVGIAAVGPDFAKVPLLLGTNLNEGTVFTNALLFGGMPVSDETEYEEAVTRTFRSAAPDVLAQYPAKSFPTPNDALSELTVDGFFACPARRQARSASGAGVDVYLYGFQHVPEKPLIPDLGAFHSSELAYVFGGNYPLDPAQPDEQSLGTQIRAYWTRFAHAGDPNGGSDPSWPKYIAKDDQSMKLDLPTSAAETGYKKTKCDFWDALKLPSP
jgi:para-nitrobenzyl esterase